MKFKFFTLTIIFSLFASIATAEMIVINGRYTVAKDSVADIFIANLINKQFLTSGGATGQPSTSVKISMTIPKSWPRP
jgi:hypothetical protein